MNQKTFIEALVVSGVYLLFRFLEMRFVTKENQPLKVVLRDTLVVYISFIAGNFIYEQFGAVGAVNSPAVFTDKASF